MSTSGGYRYQSGATYVGEWSPDGRRSGMGHLVFADGTRYDGNFDDGLCDGLGVLAFPDGAKYEGEFMHGWFHGCGTFWRADGTKYEGEFRGGRIWGLGTLFLMVVAIDTCIWGLNKSVMWHLTTQLLEIEDSTCCYRWFRSSCCCSFLTNLILPVVNISVGYFVFISCLQVW